MAASTARLIGTAAGVQLISTVFTACQVSGDAEARGFRRALVPVTSAGGQTLDRHWEDGPQLNGRGAVVGKYPDGTTAIGWIIRTGVHPEAPSWRREMDSRTPADIDKFLAATLIHATLNRELLPRY